MINQIRFFLFTWIIGSGSLISFAQEPSVVPVSDETGLITYRDVIQEDGSKDELYVRALAWVNSFYKNPSDVTRVRDREDGKIDCIHRFRIRFIDENGINRDAGTIMYSLYLECRDGRYRYTLTEFTLMEASRVPCEKWLDKTHQAYNPLWDEYLKQINDFSLELIDDLKEGMKPEKVVEDEW